MYIVLVHTAGVKKKPHSHICQICGVYNITRSADQQSLLLAEGDHTYFAHWDVAWCRALLHIAGALLELAIEDLCFLKGYLEVWNGSPC